MRTEITNTADLVVAAQTGDPRALDDLVAGYLPLVYNLVGRALNGHADVDDVVQETMLRVVRDLPDLRSPASFRSWLVAITLHQTTERIRTRQAAASRVGLLEEADDIPDAGADFAGVTVLRLGLSGQRRQVAEAARWLDDGDRELLSLWWLESGGSLERAEVAAALGLSTAHVAVRVQRMRAQLDLSRSIVRALAARPRCAGLADAVAEWDGLPSPRWRKRIARHTRDCRECAAAATGLIAPERLLAGLALVPVPAGLAIAVPSAGVLGTAAAGGVAAGVSGLLAKTVIGVAVGATVAAGTAGVVYVTRPDPPPRAPAVVAAPSPTVTTATKRAVPSSPAPKPSPRTTTKAKAIYGSVVDRADAAPPKNRKPQALPKRPEGTLTVPASIDNDPRADVYSMVHRGEQATFRGRGYLRVDYQIAYGQRAGAMTMPSWTGLKGKLFHVASGGGARLDDKEPGTDGTFMGNDTAKVVLPDGAQQMWRFEYYYLDGEVTLHQNERGADYNLYPHLTTWQQINDDITVAPREGGPLRYGLTRDDGTDACPVPQFLTRAKPEDPATVALRTRIR
jgi:RNA polymerase sigma factor (sigma-70 family)